MVATHTRPAKGYGGVAESVHTLCATWAAAGHSFRFCVSDASASGRITAPAIGLPPAVVIDLYHAMLFRRWGFGPGALLSVPRSCWRSRAVYICGIATWPTTLAALACVLLQRPFMVAPRGGLMPRLVALTRTEKPWKWQFYRLLTLPLLRRAALLHVTSAVEQEGVRALLPASRCLTLANGLDLGRWPAAPSRRGAELQLGYIGRLSREKGINRFLERWLRQRRPGERFVVAGEVADDSYSRQFRQLVAESQGAIDAVGYLAQPDLAALINSVDFIVLPSGLEDNDIRENFGNSVAEALASGRPVMVTRGLAWDHIEAEAIGLLFDPDDTAIDTALTRARQLTPAQHQEMCLAAATYAKRHLAVGPIAARLWSALADLAAP